MRPTKLPTDKPFNKTASDGKKRTPHSMALAIVRFEDDLPGWSQLSWQQLCTTMDTLITPFHAFKDHIFNEKDNWI
jgi:hypothetical protein